MTYIDWEFCPDCDNQIAYGSTCPCYKALPYTDGCMNYHAPDEGFCMFCTNSEEAGA